MKYNVIWEVAGQKIVLHRSVSIGYARKKVSEEKAMPDFGNNGYREYCYTKPSYRK